MHIILRDDDTSFFTTPAMLERVYASVWARRLPVCLAVIPAHYGAIEIPSDTATVKAGSERGTFFDPNVPPSYRGQPNEYPITENAELCAYLAGRAREGLIEICLHGYNHDWMEWTNRDTAVLQRKLDDGRRIFDAAFPGIDIRTFITPYDCISDEAFTLILNAGLNLCVHPVNVPPSFPRFTDNRVHVWPTGSRIFVTSMPHPAHDPWEKEPVDRITVWDEALRSSDEATALLIVNHYWTFFADFGLPDEAKLAEWEAALERVVFPHAARVTTFRDAAQVG